MTQYLTSPDPTFYIWGEGEGGGGGAGFETIQARYSSKASVCQARD